MNPIKKIHVTHLLRTASPYRRHTEAELLIHVRISYKSQTVVIRSSLPDTMTLKDFPDFRQQEEASRLMRAERDKIRQIAFDFIKQSNCDFVVRDFVNYLHNLEVYENRQLLINDLQSAHRLIAQLANNNVRFIATEPIEEWGTRTMQAQIELLSDITTSIKKGLPIL